MTTGKNYVHLLLNMKLQNSIPKQQSAKLSSSFSWKQILDVAWEVWKCHEKAFKCHHDLEAVFGDFVECEMIHYAKYPLKTLKDTQFGKKNGKVGCAFDIVEFSWDCAFKIKKIFWKQII